MLLDFSLTLDNINISNQIKEGLCLIFKAFNDLEEETSYFTAMRNTCIGIVVRFTSSKSEAARYVISYHIIIYMCVVSSFSI